VLLTGRPFRTDDYTRDPRLSQDYLDVVQATGVSAVLAVPVQIGARVEGVLYVINRPSHPFNDRDEDVLLRLADHAAIAINNAHLFAQVRAGRERLQALSRRLVAVQEDERRHIARELHDEVGQLLAGLKLSLEMNAAPDMGGANLREAQAAVQELMQRVRDLSLDLRPAMLDDLGLLPALWWYLERYTARTQVQVTFKHTGLENRLPPEVETAVYRLVQEGLTNVARHAGVREAMVRLWADAEIVGVQIEDAGRGFEVGSMSRNGSTSGLAGMYERANLLGGRLWVESSPGAGTQVTAELSLVGAIERRGLGR
jgi:signal transduction histidine kinase